MQRYESYKPSGVEWLAEVPAHWDIKRFRYIYTYSNAGDVIDKSYWHYGDEILFTCQRSPMSSSYSRFSRFRRTISTDLLLTRNGTPYVHLPPPGAIYSNVVQRIGLPINIDRRYVWYALSNSCQYLKGCGDIIESFNMSTWNSLPLTLPPLDEQRRIVAFLDKKTAEIDTAISKKKQLIELLQEQKSILINQAVTRGLKPDVPMKDSGVDWIGWIPEHWQQLPNKALFRERREPGQEGMPILSVSLHSGVSDIEQDETENIRAKIRIEDKTSYKRVHPGDVVYNMMRAWQGSIGVVRVDGLVSPAYVVAAPRESMDGAYFEYLYRTIGFIREMDRFSKGIMDFRKRLYWDEFKLLVSLLPPLDEQIRIAKKLDEVVAKTDDVVRTIQFQIDSLRTLKTSLISHVSTGKLKV